MMTPKRFFEWTRTQPPVLQIILALLITLFLWANPLATTGVLAALWFTTAVLPRLHGIGLLVLGALVLGGILIRLGLIDSLVQSQKQRNERSSGLKQVQLFYNRSTGELYPILPQGVKPHTCVWTIWGDHGSEMKLATDGTVITTESDPFIKSNNFLPPRVPIYVTCVDWENQAYQGGIGEYSKGP